MTNQYQKKINNQMIKTWAEIYEELIERGVKFPKNFDGAGASYAGYMVIGDNMQSLADYVQKDTIDRTMNEEWSCKWCGGTNKKQPLFGEI